MTHPLASIRAHMEEAPEGSPERLAWARALSAEAFRDQSAPRKFGPPDLRHPMERLFSNLIAAGEPVMLIGESGTLSFNGVSHVG